MPPLILDLPGEVIQPLAELGGFDACAVQHPFGYAGHPGDIQTEGLRALAWLELVKEDDLVLGFVRAAGHVVELHTIVGAELVQQHVVVRGE